MSNCKPITSLISPSTKLSTFDSIAMEDTTLYRSVVGSLQYLLISQPELAFSVNRVCQYMHVPCLSHWQAVKRILRYLKYTFTHGLLISHSSSHFLVAYSDADWASNPDDPSLQVTTVFFFFTTISSLGAPRNSPPLLALALRMNIKL